MVARLRAGIIGTGFMGAVHARAVRASGGVVKRVADSTIEGAELGRARFYADEIAQSAEELIAADDVDIVHICTPNDTHTRLASLALDHGKHVICEKPLATTLEDADDLERAARDVPVVVAVPFAYRYYPTVREVRTRVASGRAGKLHLLHGAYLQDWLSSSSDTNWRVDAKTGGASRAFGDIGVHWCDLIEFMTGHRIARLATRLATTIEQRDGDGVTPPVQTEDIAAVLFETDQGALGSVVISQVSLGRKNQLRFAVDGENESYMFDQETPDHLWVGGRTVNTVVPRGPDTLSRGPSDYAILPAGHPQGYQDCFNAFVFDVHEAVRGNVPDGLPTFADGRRAARLTNAVLASAAKQAWVEVAE
jgi:predicted dehydrogenase